MDTKAQGKQEGSSAHLGLVGGDSLARYTVADVLWNIISEVSGRNFKFALYPLAGEAAAQHFYDTFLADPLFKGFNVALPWKGFFAAKLPGAPEGAVVNTVYKTKDGTGMCTTDPIGVQKAFLYSVPDFRPKKILVLGGGGAGLPTARYLSSHYRCTVYIYDIKRLPQSDSEHVVHVPHLEALAGNKFDLIINATPLGKYYFDQIIDTFSAPLDARLLAAVTHPGSVVQEMNYLPRTTLLLQMAAHYNLSTIPGTRMLVMQALESYKYYFGEEFPAKKIPQVVAGIEDHVARIEAALLTFTPSHK